MMFSFKSLALAAGVAFAAVSSVCAAPATPAVSTSTYTADVTTTTQTYTYVKEKSVYYVLEKTKYEVTPVVQKFHYFTKQNCTVENVTPVVEELKVVLTGAIADLHALVGVDVNILLLTEGGVKVTVDVVAKLVAEILILVFGALGFVLTLVEGALYVTLCNLFAVVGGLVGTILSVVLSLVGSVLGGLVVAIVALLGDVIAIILKLNISVCISLLGL
ncbi:hypothetical protein QCA50_007300 [Cerrena zonata]|uniref:Uncharacterized protein n=1 Tax=Cerrena zonata TaxID=2478898 RepID=A0AAW0GH47_9APHY